MYYFTANLEFVSLFCQSDVADEDIYDTDDNSELEDPQPKAWRRVRFRRIKRKIRRGIRRVRVRIRVRRLKCRLRCSSYYRCLGMTRGYLRYGCISLRKHCRC